MSIVLRLLVCISMIIAIMASNIPNWKMVNGTNDYWYWVAMSASGQYQNAVTNTYIYTSIDYGSSE